MCFRDPAQTNPKDPVPLFETYQAMQSLRRSGHDFFSAVGELVDNAQEAGSKTIQVILSQKTKAKVKGLNV